MKPEVVLQALLAIWDELPVLVGPDWPKILPRLEALLDRLKATGDPDVTADLVLALRAYPAARARLQAAAAAESPARQERTPSSDHMTATRRTTRGLSPYLEPSGGPDTAIRGGLGGGDGEPAVAAGPSLEMLTDRLGSRVVEARRAFDTEPAVHAAAPLATCHVRAAMDQTMTVDRTATVEVIVSREAIGGAIHEAAAEGAAEVDPGKRLIIQVLPKTNVEIVGESRAEIDVPATGEPQTVYFDVRATDSGQASVWVVARQGQIPLVTLKLTARVVLAGSRARSMARRSAEGQASGVPQLTEPLHQLRISQAERGGTLYYEYELEAPALDLLDRFESRPITGDPQKYVSGLHKRIEDRWLSAKGDVEEFTQELREFGGELLDELMPDNLQEILWVNRRRFTSIQVLATEPFIPWELVHLRQPGRPLPGETRFLGQMGLVRWLYDSGWPPERLQVRPNRARYVIPDYPDRRYELPEAQLERGFLEEAFGATAVEPQPTPVRELISTKGAFDLLHFAGHGAAKTDAITEARLLLQGRIEDGQYIEAPFTTTTVNTRADLTATDGSRPLVVLNACQVGRLGYALTGIGGFAQAFLNGGAGAFIGTQWSVGDVPARVFTETFYRKLLDGATVAEATVASRERARADGDATWLAYAVYAHPHARLVRPGAP
jgi:hypothetical protein